MSTRDWNVPEGAEVLEASGRGGTGNVLFLFRAFDPPRVLKLYRVRRGRGRELLRGFSHRFIEGKRGAGAAARCQTERLLIDLWTREGFAVVKRIEAPLPPGANGPANWLEYVNAPSLQKLLADAGIDTGTRVAWAFRLGNDLCARHQRALQIGEPLLAHEHGSIAHFFAAGERLIAFDLEHGYRASFPVMEAIVRELEGIVRSLIRVEVPEAEDYVDALVRGYANHDLLRRAVRYGLKEGSLGRRVRRCRDSFRRRAAGKTHALHVLRSRLSNPA